MNAQQIRDQALQIITAALALAGVTLEAVEARLEVVRDFAVDAATYGTDHALAVEDLAGYLKECARGAAEVEPLDDIDSTEGALVVERVVVAAGEAIQAAA